jgi:hypothetical protein
MVHVFKKVHYFEKLRFQKLKEKKRKKGKIVHMFPVPVSQKKGQEIKKNRLVGGCPLPISS